MIERPPQDVWDYVADPTNDPRWCPKVKAVNASGERRWLVIHKPVPLRRAMELSLEHIELDPPSRLTMSEEDEVSVFNIEYRLEPTSSGTRFTQTSDFDWKKLPRILHRTFERGVRRDVRRQLDELKKLLEES